MLKVDSEEKMHVNIRVWGNVQRVFYRMAVLDAAFQYHITGWARNRDDGTVEIAAEGKKDHVKKFINACREGSDMSVVKRMRIVEEEVQDYVGFKVRS